MIDKKGKRRSAGFLRILPIWIFPIAIFHLFVSFCPPARAFDQGAAVHADEDEISVRRMEPGPRGGWAYELTYTVPASPDVYWRFKTDFDNDFVASNKYIARHRFVGRDGDAYITENEYTAKPDVPFVWKTTVGPERRRLDFELLNPEEGGSRFHYGSISLYPVGRHRDRTLVVQKAYFDFFGAGFWVRYPWAGGMRKFLEYTARWERETVLKLRNRYSKSGSRP